MPVYVTGVAETVRAFRSVGNKAAGREIQAEYRKVAEPVAVAGREKISRYQGAIVSSIVPRVAGASAFVTQKARKVTGRRGDFGGLQQRRLDEALAENESKVVDGLEGFLDRIAASEGF